MFVFVLEYSFPLTFRHNSLMLKFNTSFHFHRKAKQTKYVVFQMDNRPDLTNNRLAL